MNTQGQHITNPLGSYVEPKEPAPKEEAKYNLGALLRFIGTIVILGAAATFLLQRWEGMNHVVRYFYFLGFTGVLTSIGFVCGIYLKEEKSARTFLGISTAIVPAQFCALGGLLYSVVATGSTSYPTYLHWVAPDPMTAAIALGVSIPVLFVVSLIGFTTFVREDAKLLTAIYIAANAALVIPFRESGLAGLVGLVALVGTYLLTNRYLNESAGSKTREGKLARLMLYVPSVLIFVRTLALYDATNLFLGACLAVVTFGLFAVIPATIKDKEFASVSQAASVGSLLASWFLIAGSIDSALRLPYELIIPLYVFPYALTVFAMGFFTVGAGNAFRIFAVFALTVGMFLQLALFGGIITAFLILSLGIAVLLYGYSVKSKAIFLSGVISAICGLAYHIKYAAQYLHFSSWVSLAVLGVIIILGSSYAELYAQKAKEKISLIINNFKTV